jgi:NTP pyrophosphatase (non-canonical NTP hydrolase)
VGQLVLFPTLGPSDAADPSARRASRLETSAVVTLCGSFRKDAKGLTDAFQQLKDLRCRVLSPTSTGIELEKDGFVYMRGETADAPEAIEQRHLRAIQKSEFVWLHAPDGYVGLSAALEVGFACASGIPVFASQPIRDRTVAEFVKVVRSPAEAIERSLVAPATPSSLPAFQNYYRRMAVTRGYSSEDANQCLLLMVEEVGELARALRKRSKLTRHHGTSAAEAAELADVFLYVVHLANILQLDLDGAVRTKEKVNHERFLKFLKGHGTGS